jgi:hypothetical protein
MSPLSSVALIGSPPGSGLGTSNSGEQRFDMRTEAKALPDRQAAPNIIAAVMLRVLPDATYKDPRSSASTRMAPNKRTREPGGCVRPAALNLCIEADVAVGTRGNPRPESQFAGAAWASGACHRNAQKRPNNRSEEPEIE